MSGGASPLPYAVVLNPHAGRGLAGREWPRLAGALKARQLPYVLITADSAGQACAALAALPPQQPVLAVGGDGTAHGLLPEACRSGRPLGLIPLGSGNDLAGLLGLNAGDLDAALNRLARPAQRLDLLEVVLGDGGNGNEGEAEPQLLLNGLGMGFDAQVADLMMRAPARLLGLPLSGFPRYLWAALTGLRGLETGTLTVTLDGQPFYSGPSCLVAAMNGSRYGGGFLIAPGADLHDGQLELVLGAQLSRAALLPLMARVLRGSHLTHPQVRHARARSATLEWQSPMQAHLDGELAGRQQKLSVRVLPGALSFLSGR